MFYRVLILAVFLLITACEGDDLTDGKTDRILIPLVSGVSPFSEIRTQRFEILRSEEAYQRLFSLADPFKQPPTLMNLEFSKFVVVAALAGEKQGNARTRIIRLDEEALFYLVWVSTDRFGPETREHVYPYSFAIVRNDKPIRFGEETLNVIGAP